MKNLIVQGHDITDDAIASLAVAARAERVERVSATAWRLCRAVESDEWLIRCKDLPIDWAFVDARTRLTDFGLLVTDMDSTLIGIECIDEIADFCDLKTEISRITEAGMRGEIDFVEGLRRRVALLAGLDESALHEVYETRFRYSPGAETLIERAKAAGLKTLLVSGGFTFFTERIVEALGLDAQVGNEIEIVNGKLTGRLLGEIVDRQGKARALTEFRDRFALRPEQVIAVGDGANDLSMLEAAGFSIAYHAKPMVAEAADVAIDHVGLDGIIALFADA